MTWFVPVHRAHNSGNPSPQLDEYQQRVLVDPAHARHKDIRVVARTNPQRFLYAFNDSDGLKKLHILYDAGHPRVRFLLARLSQ